MKMIYRGSMPKPLKEHGDKMAGGIIVGRTWLRNEWEYRIIHPNGVLYVRGK